MSNTAPAKITARIDVASAAKVIGCATTTVHGMVRRGELSATRGDDGKLYLDAAAVAGIPHRPRGAPRLAADRLIGRQYKRLVEHFGSVREAAEVLGVTHQDVSDAIARYDAARKKELRVNK